MSDDLALTMTPIPIRCGKPATPTDDYVGDGTCARDTGHKGRHRPWRHPACGSCGQEMKHRTGSLTYSCEHPGIDRGAVSRARELSPIQRDVAYTMTGYPESGNAPTRDQYDQARRIVVALASAGHLDAA